MFDTRCVDCQTNIKFHKDIIRCKKCQGKYTHGINIKNLYGMSTEEYEDLFIKQKGLCAICKSRQSWQRLAVDHCHKTNKVRGLLCHNCNVMLGHSKDNFRVLLNAVHYLNEHSEIE
jgi:hypothetical protein